MQSSEVANPTSHDRPKRKRNLRPLAHLGTTKLGSDGSMLESLLGRLPSGKLTVCY